MLDPDDLAGPPSGGPAEGWIYGVLVAGVVGAYGLLCIATAHAKAPNIGVRGLAGPPGLLQDVHGVDAVLVGMTLSFLALFAHFHWFWPHRPRLGRYYEIGKVAALVGIAASAALYVYRAL